jgi:hypothetical protein
MEMDLTCLVGTAQCSKWGTGRTKLAQRAQWQRLRQDGVWAVGRRLLKIQRLNFLSRTGSQPWMGGDDTILTPFSLSPP